MAKKTVAYNEGYTAGQLSAQATSNPYDEGTEYENFTSWKSGYLDGKADRDSDDSEIEEDPYDYNEGLL